MKKRDKNFQNSEGFSLIEIIITITIASALFAMMFAYFGTPILKSSEPVTRLEKTMKLTQTAERITAHYQELINNNNNQKQIKQIKKPFIKSGLNQQKSPADILKDLKYELENKPSSYGEDYSVKCNFVKFNNKNHDIPDSSKDPEMLKVKIRQDDTNETITLLFTEQ